MKIKVTKFKKVYSKESHTKKRSHQYAPVYSHGEYTKKGFQVTVHMTPELRHHPQERKVLLRHEKREASILAEQGASHHSVARSHRQAARHDPVWLRGQKGFRNTWERLGKEVDS